MTIVRGASNGSRTATIRDIWAKPPEGLTIPIRAIDGGLEGITLGFRQHMLAITDEKGNGAELDTCAGWGGEGIVLSWKDGKKKRKAVIRGSDLVIAWVATFDPKAAEAMRRAQA